MSFADSVVFVLTAVAVGTLATAMAMLLLYLITGGDDE